MKYALPYADKDPFLSRHFKESKDALGKVKGYLRRDLSFSQI